MLFFFSSWRFLHHYLSAIHTLAEKGKQYVLERQKTQGNELQWGSTPPPHQFAFISDGKLSGVQFLHVYWEYLVALIMTCQVVQNFGCQGFCLMFHGNSCRRKVILLASRSSLFFIRFLFDEECLQFYSLLLYHLKKGFFNSLFLVHK